MHAVGAVMQCAGQRDQVLHRLPPGQRLDFDGGEAPAGSMPADRGDQRGQVIPRAHQHGDGARRIFAPLGFDHSDDPLRFGTRGGRTVSLCGQHRMHGDTGLRQ